MEMHDLPSGRIGPLWFRYLRDSKGKKRIATVTKALQNVLGELYEEQAKELDYVIAPNGVELERFENLPDKVTARFQAGLKEAPTVMCSGHLYAGRGVELFLHLAEVFVDKGIEFVWVGGNQAEIDIWKEKATLLPNMTFTGFISNNELPLYQAAADVLLMPYGREIGISSGKGHSALVSSPMKMFEYLATARPIVSSDLPVFHEVLNDRNSLFCSPDDLQEWESTLASLLADPSKQAALSTQAANDAKKYTWVERARRILANFP